MAQSQAWQLNTDLLGPDPLQILLETDQPGALALIINLDEPGYRAVGAMMAVTSLAYHGHLSAGCIDADIATHARESIETDTAQVMPSPSCQKFSPSIRISVGDRACRNRARRDRSCDGCAVGCRAIKALWR